MLQISIRSEHLLKPQNQLTLYLQPAQIPLPEQPNQIRKVIRITFIYSCDKDIVLVLLVNVISDDKVGLFHETLGLVLHREVRELGGVIGLVLLAEGVFQQ